MSGSDGSGLAGAEVLVIGATSQVGWFLLPRLVAAGARVHALSRNGQPEGFPDFQAVSWIGPGHAVLSGAGITHLVSAGPLPLALDYARLLPSLQVVSLTSSSSVLSKAGSPNPAEREVIRALLKAEKGFRDLATKRGLSMLMLRPTLLYGCGMDRNISTLAALIRRFGFIPVSTRAGGLRQPLHVDDLAQALLAGLGGMQDRAQGAALTGPLCGGEALDYRAMVRRVFQALDRPPRILAVSPRILAPALDLASRLGLLPGANGEMVRRQALNLVFDDQAVRAALKLSPRRFSPAARDFAKPEPARLQRLSRGV
jgi:uncharacterized protein YbjT (DUF2867 family)